MNIFISRSKTRIKRNMLILIGLFFKGNSSFDILELVGFISDSQVYLENAVLMDYDK